MLLAVWSEVKSPASGRGVVEQPVAPAPVVGAEKREIRPVKGRGSIPARLVVLEPKAKRGTTYTMAGVE